MLLHTLLKGETLGEMLAFLSGTSQNSQPEQLLTQVRRPGAGRGGGGVVG